jgi:hypothetical protein
MMRQKIEYIHSNPVTHWYVDEAVHRRYSSARNYAGREGLLDVCRTGSIICIPTGDRGNEIYIYRGTAYSCQFPVNKNRSS